MNFNKHICSFNQPNGQVYSYYIKTLWRYASGLDTVTLPTERLVELSNNIYNTYDEDDWLRVNEANLDYPPIVHDTFGVLDGRHRILKAAVLGHVELPVIRIVNLPEPDAIWRDWNDMDRNYDDFVEMAELRFQKIIDTYQVGE